MAGGGGRGMGWSGGVTEKGDIAVGVFVGGAGRSSRGRTSW